MNYENTREILGDQSTIDLLVSGNIESFTETRINIINDYSLSDTKLKKFYLPNVTEIRPYGLANDFRILEITEEMLPSLVAIDTNAFDYDYNLENAVFSEQTKTCARYAFRACNTLQHLLFKRNEPDLYFGSLSKKSFEYTSLAVKIGGIYLTENNLSRISSDDINILPLSSYKKTDFGTITDSFDEILASEEDGSYKSKYQIGDTKTIDLCIQFFDDKNVKEHHYLINYIIIAFDKDDLADGSGKAHITWLEERSHLYLKYAVSDNAASSDPTWENSNVRNYLNTTFLETNPKIASIAKPVIKTYTDISGSVKSVSDTISIPSVRETGYTPQYMEDTGAIYDEYFTTYSNRMFKTKSSNNGAIYYLRTAKGNNSQCTMGQNGTDIDTTPFADPGYYAIRTMFCT